MVNSSYAPMVRGPMTTTRRTSIQTSETRSTRTWDWSSVWRMVFRLASSARLRDGPPRAIGYSGLAAVVGWEAGYFHLEGFSEYGQAYDRRAQAEISALVEMHERAISDREDDYESLGDARDRVVASVVRRRGQPEFRSALLEAYGGRCAISGCDAEAALEACHIRPYMGPHTNALSNGLPAEGRPAHSI